MKRSFKVVVITLLVLIVTSCSQSVKIDEDDQVIKVAVGSSSTVILTEKGRLFAWGYDSEGELGSHRGNVIKKPAEITELYDLMSDEKIIDFSIHYGTSIARTDKGRVLMHGWMAKHYNYAGEKPLDVTPYLNLMEDETIGTYINYGSQSVLLTTHHRVLTLGYDGRLNFEEDAIDITHRFNLRNHEYLTKVVLSVYGSYALTNQHRLFGFLLRSNHDRPAWTRHVEVSVPQGYEIFDIMDFIDIDEDEVLIDVIVADRHYFLTSLGKLYSFNEDDDWVEITDTFDLLEGEFITEMYGAHETSFFITSENRVLVSGKYVFYDHEADIDAGKRSLFGVGIDLTDKILLNEGETVLDIEFGNSHIMILTSQGNIIGMGSNRHRQVWQGKAHDYEEPTVLPILD